MRPGARAAARVVRSMTARRPATPFPQPPQSVAPPKRPAIALPLALTAAGTAIICAGIIASPQIIAALPLSSPMSAVIACREAFPAATPVECGCAAWAMPAPGPSRWDAREAFCVSQGEAGWPSGFEK